MNDQWQQYDGIADEFPFWSVYVKHGASISGPGYSDYEALRRGVRVKAQTVEELQRKIAAVESEKAWRRR